MATAERVTAELEKRENMNVETYAAGISEEDRNRRSLYTLNVGRLRLVADALMSGRIKKGTYVLDIIIEGEHHMCCMGVMCKVAEAAGLPVDVVQRDKVPFFSKLLGNVNGNIVAYNGREGFPDNTVMEWIGVSGLAGGFSIPAADGETVTWLNPVNVNDEGPGYKDNLTGISNPEDSFAPTIGPAFYLLADIAEAVQALASYQEDTLRFWGIK